MKRTALIAVIAYGLMLCVVGIAGILSARWELTQIFDLNMSALDTHTQATFLNQYRFLKGLELGGGIFCLCLRQQILMGKTEGRVFLGLVGAGVITRSVAWIVDGRPSWPFVTFLVLEAVVFLITALYFANKNPEIAR